MKRRFVLCMGAMLLAGMLAAQTPAPEWQAGVDKVKSLIQSNPEQASDEAAELLKGKNKKNIELVVSVAHAYLDAGKLPEATAYLEMAKKADNKDARVSVLEGDIALAEKKIGTACQLYEQAIYFDPNCKEAYLKYAQAYKTASPAQAIEKLQQLKGIAPDYPAADKELAEVYYSSNQFAKAAAAYAQFIDTPVATEDDLLKYAFALFLNHDFEKSLQVARKGLQKNNRHAAFNRLAMYNNIDLKRYEEAEKAADAFFNASDRADYSYLDYKYYGALLSALKKYDQAIIQYRKALDKDKTQSEVRRQISEALFQLGCQYYERGTSTDSLALQPPPADRMAALQSADSVFALVSEQAPGSYLGELWRARTHSAMDPETTEGLAKPYYEKVVSVLLAKKDPKYNSALIECYSYLGYYYLLKSDNAASKECWNKILLLDPANATAKKALEGIR